MMITMTVMMMMMMMVMMVMIQHFTIEQLLNINLID